PSICQIHSDVNYISLLNILRTFITSKYYMKSEKEKMLAGELYDPLDRQLSDERLQTRLLIKALNDTREDETEERANVLKALIPNAGNGLWIQPPFYCDYGSNIKMGEKVFFNFNCVVLDVCEVTIGSRTLFGPNVQIYTATHPINHNERASGLEYAKPISIGEDVWIGGSVVICPGVSIGDRAVIGAGSVVTKDIAGDVFAAGNPCKVIRALEQNE
ncbi:MAG TPA: sugar O-acetyltransferase, partial [Flavitalea sp.]|nr:sugar O-acetyltransferase [Flavitalea sp.]